MAWYDLMDEEVERKGYDVSARDIYGKTATLLCCVVPSKCTYMYTHDIGNTNTITNTNTNMYKYKYQGL